MADRPLEYELMMSTYTQIGQDFSDQVDHLDAFVPSGVEENELGFDMQIPYLKGVAFQFKRPKGGDPRRFSLRYSNQDPPRQLDRMRNWELKFGPNAAFYALPLVVEHDSLAETLRRTAFIAASKIDPMASIVRLPSNLIQNGKREPGQSIDVYCSHPNNPRNNRTENIRATEVLGWEGLKEKLRECTAGFRLRWNEASCFDQYHDDHDWYPRQRDDEFAPNVEPTVHADRFVEARSPLLTRIGSTAFFEG